jgi:hypothetical protein
MKRLHTGILIFDAVDIVCLSFSAGSILAYSFKKYRNYRILKISNEDRIVHELKRKSSINMFSEKGDPLKLPLMRGGDIKLLNGKTIKGLSLMIKNKKLAQILMAIVNVRRNQRKLKLLQDVLSILNVLLATSTGLSIGAGGSLGYVQIILIAFPSTVGSFLIGMSSAYPLAIAALPIAILFGRDIEDIADPYEKCKSICKVAENYHNQQLMLEMKNIDSHLENAKAMMLQPPIDEVPFICTEQPLSLLERFTLRDVSESMKNRKRIQHFSEFIKKFPECAADPEAVYQEVMGSIPVIPMKR